MKWGTWLVSMVGPILFKALTMLGITIATFTGVEEMFDSFLSMAQSNWASMPVAVLQLASIWGWDKFLGITFGAAMARLSIWLASAATRFVFSK